MGEVGQRWSVVRRLGVAVVVGHGHESFESLLDRRML